LQKMFHHTSGFNCVLQCPGAAALCSPTGACHTRIQIADHASQQRQPGLRACTTWAGAIGLALHWSARRCVRQSNRARLAIGHDHMMMVDVAVLPAQDPAVAKVRAAELLRLPHVRSVAVRKPASKALEWVAGDPNLEIIYKEAGLAFRLDLARRLSRLSKSQGSQYERQRICEQVEDGERVLVLGAGIGLTPCLLARHTPCAEANRVCLKVQNFNR